MLKKLVKILSIVFVIIVYYVVVFYKNNTKNNNQAIIESNDLNICSVYLVNFPEYKYESVVAAKIYTKPKNSNYQKVFDIYGNSEEEVKEEFLKAKIFDGKSFWEVEKEIAWYDEI